MEENQTAARELSSLRGWRLPRNRHGDVVARSNLKAGPEVGKARQGKKGKGQMAYTHHGRRLELWLAGEPGTRGKGTN